MIATPAVDLRGGRCVQLVGGRPEDERITLPDPVAVARDWYERGFRSLHVVDLDAALGSGDNRAILGELLTATDADVQVGGGVRDEEAVEALLAAGADRVVVGTRAVDDPEWLQRTAAAHPGRIVVAADMRDGTVLRKGWTEASGLTVARLLERLAPLPLGGVLCTDVGREGRMEGIDRPGAMAVVSGSVHPVWISGGIATMHDLKALEGAGAHGVVLGMALYSKRLDADAVAARWGAHRGTSTEEPQ